MNCEFHRRTRSGNNGGNAACRVHSIWKHCFRGTGPRSYHTYVNLTKQKNERKTQQVTKQGNLMKRNSIKDMDLLNSNWKKTVKRLWITWTRRNWTAKSSKSKRRDLSALFWALTEQVKMERKKWDLYEFPIDHFLSLVWADDAWLREHAMPENEPAAEAKTPPGPPPQTAQWASFISVYIPGF